MLDSRHLGAQTFQFARRFRSVAYFLTNGFECIAELTSSAACEVFHNHVDFLGVGNVGLHLFGQLLLDGHQLLMLLGVRLAVGYQLLDLSVKVGSILTKGFEHILGGFTVGGYVYLSADLFV